MKLVQKNNKIFFQFTLLALLAWAVLFFWVINRIVLNEVDEKLKNNLTRMENRIEAGEPIPHFPPGIEVKKWGSMPTGPEVKILDTLIFDPLEKEKENFRQLTSLYADQIGNVYQITLRASLVETEDLFFALGISLLVLCFILGGALFWWNKRYTRKLWRPFYQYLDHLRQYDISKSDLFDFEKSQVDEFEELRKSLVQLTGKAHHDYQSLREFSEDASHEIQTPLTLITSKIEALMETEEMPGHQMKVLEDIYQGANRLSRLNKHLLLLTRIDNHQFNDVESIIVAELIQEELAAVDSILATREITVNQNLDHNREVRMSKTLLAIIIKNLLGNAIKFSRPGDTLAVEFVNGRLAFSNPGNQPLAFSDQLFKRFYTRGGNENSLGLGLAIVKKIADLNDCQPGYQFEKGFHHFYIIFPNL
ncbi:MAG: HAMP domain-containing histidine kinase [Saprospiraceae bacterium]|nr:HAMP domain-containing histidine kinase [Saprospiraceae bacterium]MCB9326806.1 HAMP domain-containing histidine kinase [Lewinellaceae bacterium]